MSATTPYPTDAGKKVVVAGLVEYWCARVGARNVHYVLLGPPDAGDDGFPVPVRHVRRPGMAEQIGSVARRTVMARRYAFQESMLYARRVLWEIRRVLAEIDADVEIYDTVRLAQYGLELPARRDERRIAYLDDLFSLRYERMRAAMRGPSSVRVDALGEFSAVIPPPLRQFGQIGTVQRALLRAEQHLVARRELVSARAFAATLLVNSAEAAYLAGRAGVRSVHALPPLVGAPDMSVRRSRRPRRQFVFLGLMTLPHNHDAMATFLCNQMGPLLSRVPDAVVRIVGRGVASDVVALASRFGDHVRVDGYVADLDNLFAESCAMISPLRFGSGVKLKMLEALARGVPVIATAVAADGVAAGPQHGVLIEDDLDQHPVLMQNLTEPGYNERLSAMARAHFAATYTPRAVFHRYDEIFGF